jgi:hypothetical protein
MKRLETESKRGTCENVLGHCLQTEKDVMNDKSALPVGVSDQEICEEREVGADDKNGSRYEMELEITSRQRADRETKQGLTLAVAPSILTVRINIKSMRHK